MKKFKKTVACLLMATTVLGAATLAYASSESLNNGGATWYGGEDGDGILYSRLEDNKSDGIRYHVTVWCKSDDGQSSSNTGDTFDVGRKGCVSVTRGATHQNIFVVEKCGYKNFYSFR
ncbi:hypothetical protein [Eubacterium sp.]|uniref:hypothetical protein n=1 Tax=Eubacterium sp. TaxID=142586 RepID=UPI0025EEF1E9|nr:hypothetical protein [Eubacterium sp.]MCR5630049.1 hypothetical protein [Eubacterium sp.]